MNTARKLPPLTTDGARMVLKSPYGQLRLADGTIIKNGAQGIITDARQNMVHFDGLLRSVNVPQHWISVTDNHTRNLTLGTIQAELNQLEARKQHLLKKRAALEYSKGVYRCVICHINPVNPEDGYDTCDSCTGRI